MQKNCKNYQADQVCNKMKMMSFAAIFAVLYFSSDLVLASSDASIGTVATTLNSTLKAVGSLIAAASYVAGIASFLMGLLKLKAHKDSPQQVPLSQAFMLLGIGAGLAFLPSIISIAGGTLFGTSTTGSAGTSGTGITGLSQ